MFHPDPYQGIVSNDSSSPRSRLSPCLDVTKVYAYQGPSPVSDPGRELGLGLDTTNLLSTRPHQTLSLHSPGIHPSMFDDPDNQSNYLAENDTQSCYPGFYNIPSPLLSPMSPMNSPVASPCPDQLSLPQSGSQFNLYMETDLGSGGSGRPPLFSLNTQGLDHSHSFMDSEAFSGSTPDPEETPSPHIYPTSSTGTSPMQTSSDSGLFDMPSMSPCFGSDPMADDSPFRDPSPQPLDHDQRSEEDTTPTSLSQLPGFNSNHLLQVPPTPYQHRRRKSDPLPNGNAWDEVQSISRGRSVKRNSRGRALSRVNVTRKQLVQDSLDAGDGVPPRSPTPGVCEKGRRHGPMSEKGRSDATDRRLKRDACIPCKVSRTKVSTTSRHTGGNLVLMNYRSVSHPSTSGVRVRSARTARRRTTVPIYVGNTGSRTLSLGRP